MVNHDYRYNPEFYRVLFNKNYFVNKKLGFQVIENGMILPQRYTYYNGEKIPSWYGAGGLVDSKGEFVKRSFLNEEKSGFVYTPPPETVQNRHETVIYLGLFFPVWGHVMTDNISRLWFLNNEIFRKEFEHCPIVYIPWREGYYTMDRMPDAARLLEILGVNLNRLQPITQPTKFDKIVVFDFAFRLEYFTKEYQEMIDIVRNFAMKNRTPTSNKKIYFFYGSKQVGEERMAEYFKSKGYAIITHEQRSDFDEELNLLINAESFASPLGSCAQNSIFLRDKIETILIPRSVNVILGHQLILNQVHPLNVNLIDSTMSVFNTHHDSYCFIISEQLKRYFGDKWDGYKEEDFKAFLDYARGYIKKLQTVYFNQMEGYGTIFSDFMEQLKKREDLIVAYNMPPDWEKFCPVINYFTYVRNRGWKDGWKGENSPSNPLDQQLEVLAIKINLPRTFHKIHYSVYYNDEEGWAPEVLAPAVAGTLDKNKPIYGMRVRLDEDGSKEFDILYRMHKFDDTWTPWAKNGEALYSHGIKLNAIQMKSRPLLTYQTHVHNKGWGDGWKNENEISNPLDQKLDVLAIKINVPNHKVWYSVYFNEQEGWSKEVSSPEMAGTVGVRKPIYGMRVRLDEDGSKEFDILYRMHKFDDTWTPWAKNGETLYSYGVKLNAIQIKLESKT